MAEVQTLIRLTTDASKPVEEAKACIVAIIQPHVGNQLKILQEIDLWLGETISAIERGLAETNQSKVEPDKTPQKEGAD